jgi:hypothetical protein
MRKSVIVSVFIWLSLNPALAQKNEVLNLKYGDNLQLVTNDSFWYKGIFVLQNDSMLILQKLYADNFYVPKKNIVFIKINKDEMKAVFYQDSFFVETNTKKLSSYPNKSTDVDENLNSKSNSKTDDEFIDEWEKFTNKSTDYGDLYTGNYFFSGSAIQLPKNEGYYKATYLLFHTVNYSLTDYLSIGAGTEFFTMALGVPFGMLQSKLTTQLDKNIHVGVKYDFFTPLSKPRIIDPTHIVMGIFTWGTYEANISVNFGGKMGKHIMPAAAVSGYYETEYNFALITESLIIPIVDTEYISLFSFGARWVSYRDVIWEAALYTNIDLLRAGIIPVLPYLGAQYRF